MGNWRRLEFLVDVRPRSPILTDAASLRRVKVMPLMPGRRDPLPPLPFPLPGGADAFVQLDTGGGLSHTSGGPGPRPPVAWFSPPGAPAGGHRSLVRFKPGSRFEREFEAARRTIERDTLLQAFSRHGFLTVNREVREVLRVVERIARSRLALILEGETGTGKEVIARAVHKIAMDEGAPFMAINCGAIPSELVEGELFGHEKGAFTGAHKRTDGLIMQANGGTLFLDEIDSLSASAQTKLLRALQERKVRRVGGWEEREVSFRLIVATNKDLWALVESGQFREDLYYRLGSTSVRIPPLRDRPDDVLPLMHHFFETELAQVKRTTPVTLGDDLIDLFIRHTWRGNVRQLANAVTFLVAILRGDELHVRDLEGNLARMPGEARRSVDPVDSGLLAALERGVTLRELQARYVDLALEGRSQREVARLLGVSPRSIGSHVSRKRRKG